jgi:hypothetical protein
MGRPSIEGNTRTARALLQPFGDEHFSESLTLQHTLVVAIVVVVVVVVVGFDKDKGKDNHKRRCTNHEGRHIYT